LQGNIALLVSVKDPETLDDAISATKKIEARSYYGNITVRKKGKSNNDWEAEANNPKMRLQPEEAPVPLEKKLAQPSHTLKCEVEANYDNVNDDYDLEREVFAGESPATYLFHVEELLTTPVEPETKDLEERISEMDVKKDIFAQNVEELGCTNRTDHVIDTGDAAPIKQKTYRATWCSRVHKE
ncbi:26233_t:CDS:2, partial [Racocetra persica]